MSTIFFELLSPQKMENTNPQESVPDMLKEILENQTVILENQTAIENRLEGLEAQIEGLETQLEGVGTQSVKSNG